VTQRINLRTPLKNARYLGSAKEGAHHFWLQRVTAVANLILVVGLVWLLVTLAGADHATTKSALNHPLVALGLILLVVSGTVHMRLGMQTIIEDYVHGETAKIVLLMSNVFFAVAVAGASVLAILKVYFGA
jgi:succinate dehydrogenase / fumarate reductase membrane anchor subunit